MEEGKWVTINGAHVLLKDGQSPMDAFIRQSGKSEEQKQKEKEELKQKLKEKAQQLDDYVKNNSVYGQYMTESQMEEYIKMHKELEDIKYELETQYYKEITETNIKDDRITGFSKDVYVQARKDDLRNKDIYDALSEASFGVKVNSNTPVDDIMEGKNINITPKQLYDNFNNTRQLLTQQYGDEITLYRVEGKQKAKATKNYGSSIEYTKQYGEDVKKYKIKTKDIVAIWTNRKGTYEDIIVAQGGIEKYIK